MTFQAVAAAFQHLIADDLRNRFFCHSWPDLAQDLADDPVGQLAHLLEHRDFFVRLDHACVEIEFAARHECRARQPLAEPDVILRGHVIELDRDLPRSDPCFQQRIGEQIYGLLRELVIGADIGEARALLCQVLLDIDHDLSGELLAGKHGDGATETVARVTGDQESRSIGDVILGKRDECVMSGLDRG